MTKNLIPPVNENKIIKTRPFLYNLEKLKMNICITLNKIETRDQSSCSLSLSLSESANTSRTYISNSDFPNERILK